jgi:hypothetical protein
MYVQSLLRNQSQVKSFPQLFAFKKHVNTVIAISAYVDIDSIDQLIEFVKEKCFKRSLPSLRFFIDRSSSHFFSDLDTRNELIKRDENIRTFCNDNSGIYLVRLGALFHSKAYLIEGRNTGKVFFGSLNLTSKGITSNEELIVSDEFNVDGHSYGSRLADWVKEYADGLHINSVRVNVAAKRSQPGSVSCMRQMLLEGTIWYEQKEQKPFGFSLHLPEGVANQRANIDPLLDASVTDSISIERLITAVKPHGLEIALPPLRNTKSLWKKYCIETCYGYWNPECLQKALSEEIDKREISRKPYYDKILECIQKDRQELLGCFLQLQGRVQRYLVQNGVSGWKYANQNDAEVAWNIWLDRVLDKVGNPDYYKRLLIGISSVPTPDVWNDPLSAGEFEESFCESLLYLWSKEYSKETSNIVAQNVRFNLNLGEDKMEGIRSTDLQDQINKWLFKYRTSVVREIDEEN